MKLIVMPKPNYCLISSFAMVLNCEVSDLVKQVGHDGYRWIDGKNIWTGFHTQELIDCAIARDYAVTKIQAFPTGQSIEGHMFDPFDSEKANKRLAYHMTHTDGILLGTGMTDKNHASAWEHEEMFVYDPSGGMFPASGIKNYGFKEIIAFLRFDKIDPYPKTKAY